MSKILDILEDEIAQLRSQNEMLNERLSNITRYCGYVGRGLNIELGHMFSSDDVRSLMKSICKVARGH